MAIFQKSFSSKHKHKQKPSPTLQEVSCSTPKPLRLTESLAEILSSMPNPTGFLRLPAELRNEIYHYCLVQDTFNDACFSSRGLIYSNLLNRSGPCSDLETNLLLVSKQVREEAYGIMYSKNTFRYPFDYDNGLRLRTNFTPAEIGRIRKLCIVIEGYDAALPDMELWSPILAQLNRLIIVAREPLDYTLSRGEKEVARRIWFDTVMTFISAHIPDSLVVDVDDGHGEEERSWIELYFPGRYRKMETIDGDLIFNRGEWA
ncbi:hypothetical protein BU16DRAFT_71344 [Lophium mytilinum]|uniref:F-box domain-containing protein n=1 Tax=Lophium mytilinum TaxID=390894 RepID=A0A6A6QLZ3_9PEZI|nr:hypothetical protein BU16DRAFT_71344 [Lophium mytilinum]